MSKKGKHKWDNHHKLPRSRGGDNSSRNIVRVRKKQHRAYHLLAGTDSPREFARALTKTWIDPRFYLCSCPRKRRKPNRVKYLLRIEDGCYFAVIGIKRYPREARIVV